MSRPSSSPSSSSPSPGRRAPSRALSVAAALALAATVPATTGCYYTFGTRPPAASAGPPGVRPDCSRSRVLPIIDTINAIEGASGVGLGAMGLLFIKDDGSLSAGEAKAWSGMFLVTGLLMLVPSALSARRGFRDTARCRALG